MKAILRTTLILATIIVTTVIAARVCLAAVVDETASITATASKEEDIDPTSPILDDFNDGGITNHWGGETGTFDNGGNGSCGMSNDSGSPSEGDFCLKLDYDVSTAEGFSGYFSKLQSKNLSSYTSISFYVKGASGEEFFKIELKNNSGDANRNHAAVYITDYLDGGVTTNWQKVTIPFHNFANISDWSSMKEFVIVFENVQSNINGSPKQGTIYIDKITFSNPTVNIVRIDHYGDKLGVGALGGSMGDMGSGTSNVHSFSSTAGTFHNSPNGLKIDYTVNIMWSYGATFTIFGGGDNGWTKIAHDFSNYNYISFWIKAESDTKNPQGIKIELHDFVGGSEPFYVIDWWGANPITTEWKQYIIALEDFKDWEDNALDKSRISELVFTFEWANSADSIGTVYIDDVQFTKE